VAVAQRDRDNDAGDGASLHGVPILTSQTKLLHFHARRGSHSSSITRLRRDRSPRISPQMAAALLAKPRSELTARQRAIVDALTDCPGYAVMRL
jgi:hypothetical protein